jgi:hypothetical protein
MRDSYFNPTDTMRALQPPFVQLVARGGSAKGASIVAVLRICLALVMLAIFLTPCVWLLSRIFTDEFRNGGVDGLITENSRFLAIMLFLYTGSILTTRAKRSLPMLLRLTGLWAVVASIPLIDHHTLSWMRSIMLILVAVLAVRTSVRDRQVSVA